MTHVKTSELTGVALDWAVAQCDSVAVTYINDNITQCLLLKSGGRYNPHVNWVQGGQIIEREGISWHCGNKSSWHSYGYGSDENSHAPTPLVAAMRCYVAGKLGDTVEVPSELF